MHSPVKSHLQTASLSEQPTGANSDRRIALLVFAVVLAFYQRLAAPDVLPGDPGELQMAAWRLGLAHATGYPLYLLLGFLWQHLLAPLGIAPAAALTYLSAVFGAGAVALLYRLLVDWLPGEVRLRRLAALLAALFFAVNPTFWSQNLIAEVYTLHALLIVAIFRRASKMDKVAGGQGDRVGSSFGLVLLFGLSLTHHATALFLLPGLLYLLWPPIRASRTPLRTIGLCLGAVCLPLLLYVYVPLRSTAAASPWYHVRLGEETLALYAGGWQGFFDFVSGRSISVGFSDVATAWANVTEAGVLWRLHFGGPGLVLIGIGLWSLIHGRRWVLLALIVPLVLLQQCFNLFYAIGDIFVYYIPLYLVGAIGIGFGALYLASGGATLTKHPVTTPQSPSSNKRSSPFSLLLLLALFYLPFQLWVDHVANLDQSQATTARQRWEAILAAQPEQDAILVSNDRDEIVPLIYLQAVEGRVPGLTGLFPLLTPEARFADIGATVETALQSGRPVYLIKPMEGLAVKFRLEPATPPLVAVAGLAVQRAPAFMVDRPFAGLTLLGFDWQQAGEMVQVDLYWRVDSPLSQDATTTVQIFDAAGEKLGQEDRAVGGVYYPTTYWKPGEQLLDSHTITLTTNSKPAQLLVGMYSGPALTALAEPIIVKTP